MSNTKARSRFLLSPVALLRLSSLLFVFLMFGHMSAYPWSSASSLQEAQLVASMKSTDFTFMGERSSYWGLYFGWGILVALLLFTMAAMLWLLSDLARLAPRRVGVITGVISASCLIGATIKIYKFTHSFFLYVDFEHLTLDALTLQCHKNVSHRERPWSN